MHQSRRRVALVALSLAMSTGALARGGQIILSDPVSATPISAGNGLVGDYYRPINGFEAGSAAVASAYVAGHAADATFVSTAINYPYGGVYGNTNFAGDGSSVASYLGADSNSLAATGASPQTTAQILANTLDGTIYNFKGYLAITSAEVNTSYKFYLGSDDGSTLTIGGALVVDNGASHPFTFSDGGNTVVFTKAGLYAVDVLYYEDNGGTGVALGSTLAGNGPFGGLLTSANFYQSAGVVPVPEPTSLALVASACVAGLGIRRWRLRRSGRA